MTIFRVVSGGSEVQIQITMKRNSSRKIYPLRWALCGAVLLIAAACTTQQQQRQTASPSETPAPKSAPAATASNEGTIKTDLVTLRKSAPASAAIGETFDYTIAYSALENLDSLTITDKLGEGVSFVRSEPEATPADGRLTWVLKDLDKGASGTIRVSVKAEREGTAVNCATVAAIPKVCVATIIGKASLVLEKTGPAEAVVGEMITYIITIKNTGSLTARNVVIVDDVPEKMVSASGTRRATVQVGDLAPGESKTASVAAKATEKGRFCNVVKATSSNAGEANAEACTTFLQPGVKLTKEGPERQFLGRPAQYTLVVSNSGETPLTNVSVSDTAPEGTSIAAAPGATVTGNKAVWNIGNLAAGQERRLNISLTAAGPGNHCNKAVVTTGEGLTANAEACTVWSGVGALLLELVDNPDPIQINENTTYTIRVTNQGTADDTNIKVVVEFPAQIDPVSASNGGTIAGKTVTFPPFPRLTPKQAFEYQVVGKGVTAGDARLRITRTSDGIPAPTSAEESTRVF